MEQTRNLLLPVERITPQGHYFFGYYDVPAWSADGRYHLCHSATFSDRPPGPDDVAVLGMIRLEDKAFLPIAETNAWNFQQGSMLQWHPAAPDTEIIFNRRDADRFVAVVKNVHTSEERVLSRPVAAVSPNGRHALSISFSRLFDLRPICGYAGVSDPLDAEDHPENDGVFLIDLLTGESKLIISLADIYRAAPHGAEHERLYVNHIGFNTDGARFFFLTRYHPRDGQGGFKTLMMTSDLTGRDLHCWSGYGHASHYCWRDPKHVLCYCAPGTSSSELFLLTDKSRFKRAIDRAFFTWDGHCSYSPDRKWILYDSHSADGYRYLHIYSCARKGPFTLGGFHSPPVSHPRHPLRPPPPLE